MTESTSLAILIVEDDAPLARQLAQQLARFGHRAQIAGDGRAAQLALARDAYDALVLDRMLPVMDGVSMIQSLRESGVNIPTLMLTALGQTADKVEGLDAGADDYAVKPVDPIELNARLHALVRARHWPSQPADTIRVGDIVVSPTSFRAWRDGKDLDLPKTELKLLAELARNAGTVLTRPMLLERVWDYDFEPTTNIVDAYIKRLRRKLTQFGGDDPISTLWGVGYMLKA